VLFSLQNVQKRYGALEALGGLTVEVAEGSVGLLGPNGAGKTTLIEVLLGLTELSGGDASVLGHRLPEDARAIRQAIGYMPENDCYLPHSTAVDFVSLSGRLSGMPRAEAFRRAHQVLEYVGLEEARYRQLSDYSQGMKQRVKLAQALVHGPELVFLDEPTSGLDPTGRDEMIELIEDVKSRNINVVVSSHVLPEVEQLCDSVLMLDQGRLVHYGEIAKLKEGDGGRLDIKTRDQNDELAALLTERGFSVETDGLTLHVALAEEESPDEILRTAVDHDIQIRHFMRAELTLEAAFLQLLDSTESAERSAV
jgi:ABC-2 type transport system ATP-binding protein